MTSANGTSLTSRQRLKTSAFGGQSDGGNGGRNALPFFEPFPDEDDVSFDWGTIAPGVLEAQDRRSFIVETPHRGRDMIALDSILRATSNG